ncbi:uncharacterized protein LOC132256042 [Phlebotomus argentipes]|uniref:uncharacterized protein LOC132256042 n=1 Tax=Phlebotomus argentipes TaxID=94469 RepID=UPI0028935452|nr:uncharacterized protein LOC132256042 [Phlebotomus argentipes]
MEKPEKPTRKRRFLDKPMKKWTFEEENKILDYLIGHQPIEMPTGRAYYQQLVDDFNWSVAPTLVRFKVANMQRIYYKTLEWRQATIESGNYNDDMIKDYLKKRCPHFRKLAILFASSEKAKKATKSLVSHKVDESNGQTENLDKIDIPPANAEMLEAFKVEYEEPDLSWISQASSPECSRLPAATAESGDPLRDLDSTLYARGGSREAMELKKEQMSLQWMRLEIEKQKVELQREQLQEEAKYKVLQLEQQERIRKHQIDRETEVRKYELSLKYKADLKSEM